MKRRTLMQALVIGLVAPSFARAEKKTQIDVFKTSSCGCCVDWISHLEQNGFEVIAHNVPKTGPYRLRFGVPPDMASCLRLGDHGSLRCHPRGGRMVGAEYRSGLRHQATAIAFRRGGDDGRGRAPAAGLTGVPHHFESFWDRPVATCR